jgi:hypothetical protein
MFGRLTPQQYVAGSWSSMAPAIARNYAAVATDAGHAQNDTGDASSWALGNAGVNNNLLLDFASRSVHDMTVIGKAVAKSFYGSAPKYAYWQGCSTGGRQGYMEAQMYPGDYNGIVASAPAINWNDFTPAQQWPFTVMNNEGYAPAQCEFDAINAATIAACDGLDGLVDGIIAAPGLCKFDPASLVGKKYICITDGTSRRFTSQGATVVKKIWQGPLDSKGDPLWYGILPGTNFSSLAPTQTFSNGTTIPLPFEISNSWFQNFIFKNKNYDTSAIPYSQFPPLITQSHAVSSSHPNVSPGPVDLEDSVSSKSFEKLTVPVAIRQGDGHLQRPPLLFQSSWRQTPHLARSRRQFDHAQRDDELFQPRPGSGGQWQCYRFLPRLLCSRCRSLRWWTGPRPDRSPVSFEGVGRKRHRTRSVRGVEFVRDQWDYPAQEPVPLS